MKKSILIFLACLVLFGLGYLTGRPKYKNYYVKTKHQTIEMDSVHYVIIYTYQFSE